MSAQVWLVHGPPGTGLRKTRFLSDQAARAADTHGPDSVAIASLTRAAAHEIASRTILDPDQVGTLHAHCYRALNKPALAETPEGIRAFNEAHPALKLPFGTDQLEDAGQDPADDPADDPGAGRLHQAIMLRRARLQPPGTWTPPERDYHRTWTDWKRQTRRLDFADLIDQALKEIPAHPAGAQALLIDEAQDCSAAELALIQSWARHTKTTVVCGDLDQAIYQWRGADPKAFRRLSLAGERVLGQSHRVPQAVHQLAARWIAQTPGRRTIAYEPRPEPGHAARARTLHLADPAPLAARLQNLLDDDGGGTVMILATCGYMLNGLLRELRHRGIPFHNPHRRTSGAWNPMRGARRLAAYLRHDPRVWGDCARAWTWEDLHAWIEPLDARQALPRGTKAFIETMITPDRFGETRAQDEVPLDTLCTLLGDPGTLTHPAFHADTEWWASSVRASKRSTVAYPLQVLARRGGAALTETPRLIVGTGHCSPPDEPILTTDGWVPIDSLDPERHRLASYHRGTNTLAWGGRQGAGRTASERGFPAATSSHHHDGQLVTINAGGIRHARVTPDHRVLARLSEPFFGQWVVYLMRRGDWWRIGTCLSGHRPYKAGGVSGRLSTEQADAAWILDVAPTRGEAAALEARWQGQTGIPGLTFEASKARTLRSEQLHAIHRDLAPFVAPRAAEIFAATTLDPACPLYTRATPAAAKRNMRGLFVAAAGNLVPLDGLVEVPTVPGDFVRGSNGSKPIMEPAAISTEDYAGPVFGLDVPPHHYYVSGGVVVHNSVKGGEADHVLVAPDLSRQGAAAWERCGDDRAQIVRLLYVMLTRARETVTVLDPAGPGHVPLELLEPAPLPLEAAA